MVGPGGAGKTALALATARTALDTAVGAASDGVVVVECGRLPAEPDSGPEESSGLVAEALRSAIDARPNGRESALGAVVRVLQGERRLVVLDNAEHVRASCNRLVDQLVRSCPSLRIVVTSRRQLGLPLETVWEVEPLALPAENETRGAELLASPAVQLFVELARLIRRGIDTDSQLPAIARICRHVEGLPLAIELATARLRAMSIADLAVRLEASAAVISAGSDHRLPHQRALKATYEWSAQLLPPAERRLLARLAVFPTSFELTAAERVCGHSGTDSEDIPVLLGNLVDHSMIQVIDEGDQLRYRLLIPIREFAADGTDEADLDITRRRHLDWCASVLAAINETIDDEQRTIQISAVRGEMDNIYAALGWALDRDDEELTEVSAELLAAARPVFDSDYGKLQTARHYTHRALSRWDTMSPEVHGRLRHWAGRLAYLQGRPLEARSHLETALALLRGKSADIYRLRLDIGLGIAACRYVMVDPGCLDIVDNCLVNAEAVGDSELLASILADAASFSTHWGQMSRAESFFRRAQALAEPNGTVNFRIQYRLANYFLMTGNPQKSVEISGKLLYDPTGISASRAIETQAYHGWAHARLGDFETGRDHLRQSLELALGRPLDRTYILLASADLERLAGDLGKSAKYLRSSLTASLGFSDLHTAVLAVWLTAALAESLDPEQASSVVALALACRRITQLPAWPLDDETFDSWAEMERQIGRDSSVPDRDHDVIVHAAEQCRLLLASWDGR
jgi:predicted ATPase